MKKCLTLLIATVLSGISLTAYAAQPMSNLDSGQLRPAGTVSATGASNLSDLEDKLAEKAREQGAKGYVTEFPRLLSNVQRIGIAIPR
ncbi:TPA: DUF1471 domain-containing protein [Escherichia coli]|nr:DUF1471 domain-containing protein [Escherichia coli]HCJ8567638.1 DUF1471 domain-containing protein [Escherichia coli]HCJ8698356.1 DUF1471 domain-containing protein [Escherichia coli]HCJ8702558.1 DUF1471 domain-containing protein [Escherichia coli]HCJ9384927.1 DUF1471 domain-containing protein [Escherichia coli]